jgi:hypothetical protein
VSFKKFRLEFEDKTGNKYTLSFKGVISREKITQVLDLVEILGGSIENKTPTQLTLKPNSKFEKLILLIKENFPLRWFTSSELQLSYEDKYKEPISLSTVATYLSRYYEKGILIRHGSATSLKYKIKLPEELSQNISTTINSENYHRQVRIKNNYKLT